MLRRDGLRMTLGADLDSFRKASESNGVGDPGDAAVDTANDEICSQLVEIESRELGRIEQALQRIAAGTYGRCEHCGSEISAARLDALPYADCCIDCQREIERQGRSKRPDPGSRRQAKSFGQPIEGEDDARTHPGDLVMDSLGSARRLIHGLLV